GLTIYDDAERSALPASTLTYSGFTHTGPCEVWCDDTKVLFDYDCQTTYPDIPATMAYDESLCANANRLTIYWIGLHGDPWQVYTDCVWLEGGSGSGSAPAAVGEAFALLFVNAQLSIHARHTAVLKMNVLALLASGAAVLASVPSVLGHGNIVDPAAQWVDGYAVNGWGSSIVTDVFGSSVDNSVYGYGTDGTLAFFEAMFPESGYDSLGQFIDANQVMYSDAVDVECGYTVYDDAARSTMPATNLTYTGFTHPGPCEVWCDDNKVLFDYDCQTTYPDIPAGVPYDESLCADANRFTIYWLGVHGDPWQVFTDCVLLGTEAVEPDDWPDVEVALEPILTIHVASFADLLQNNGATETNNGQTTTSNAQATTTATSSPEAASYTNNDNNQQDNGGSSAAQNGGQSSGSQEGGGLGIPVIVGIVVGSVAVVLMIAAFVIWYRRTKRSSRSPRYSTSHYYTGTNSSRKERGDRVVSNTIPMAVPVTGEFFDEITSVEILGRRSQMEESNVGDSWEDPEIQAARIPMEHLRVQQLINRGGFGEVFLGTYRGRAVAVKRLLPDRRKNMREVDAFIAEIKLMLSMDHPRIVGCLGVAWDAVTDISAVSEYMEGGDLRSVLVRFEQEEHRAHGFDDDKLKIALHVAEGLVYLHALDPTVLHRDLKSKNILLNKNLDAKLTDFGVSRESADVTMTAGVGTSLWMAPEVMIGDRYNEKADMFSFGVVLGELDCQQLPYSHATESGTSRKLPGTAILQMVASGQLRLEICKTTPSGIHDLVMACTSLTPEERPTAAEALETLQAIARETLTISSHGCDEEIDL
ncbi:hypothetical protein BBJ28_00017887, partial [Nothophytophthora sp. Chile5]